MPPALPFYHSLSVSSLRQVREILQRGGVIAFPTESVYALGANPWNEAALTRIAAMKSGRERKPLLVLIGEHGQLAALVESVPPAAQVLMDVFWPGPLTVIVPAPKSLPTTLTAGTGTVGIRLTADARLAALLRQVGPLTGTSANRSGADPARTVLDVEAALGSAVDLILDGGLSPGGVPSTVVAAVGPPRLLREGPVTRSQLVAVLAPAGYTLSA